MLLDISVHLAELRTVAFINDENALFIRKQSHYILILLILDSVRHFLNGRYDKRFIRITQVIYKCCGAVSVINAALFKAVVLVNGLIVQVLAVDKEKHLVDQRIVTKQSCELIASFRLLPRIRSIDSFTAYI